MNWLVLLLLFCCSDCGCDFGCNKKGCCRNHERHECERSSEGREESCRCCEREERKEKEERGKCDTPGMVPPPWQEYPSVGNRREENCECGCK